MRFSFDDGGAIFARGTVTMEVLEDVQRRVVGGPGGRT